MHDTAPSDQSQSRYLIFILLAASLKNPMRIPATKSMLNPAFRLSVVNANMTVTATIRILRWRRVVRLRGEFLLAQAAVLP
jgi:hypothetical protein